MIQVEGYAMVTAQRLAEEAERMRRVPGIYFMDEHDGRRAKVGGTGIDVSTVVDAWRASQCDLAGLCGRLPMLRVSQVQAALAYYALYPGEIDERLARADRVQAYVEEHGAPLPPYPQAFSELLR